MRPNLRKDVLLRLNVVLGVQSEERSPSRLTPPVLLSRLRCSGKSEINALIARPRQSRFARDDGPESGAKNARCLALPVNEAVAVLLKLD